MNLLKKFLFELQEITNLIIAALIGLGKSPRYFSETIRQMDLVGVGSLPIVVLTGFFTGGVIILQSGIQTEIFVIAELSRCHRLHQPALGLLKPSPRLN